MLAQISTGQMLRLDGSSFFIYGHSVALTVPFFSLDARGTFEASLYCFIAFEVFFMVAFLQFIQAAAADGGKNTPALHV